MTGTEVCPHLHHGPQAPRQTLRCSSQCQSTSVPTAELPPAPTASHGQLGLGGRSGRAPQVHCCPGERGSAGCISWRCGPKVGGGAYGCVYKAQDTQTGQIFAVKTAVLREAGESHGDDSTLVEEPKIPRELRHPRIVSHLGHDCKGGTLCIFMEYVPGGSVASMLTEFGPLDGHNLRRGMQELLEGLDYLHTRSPPVVHRDLKAANVLVDLELRFKISDFGCSKHEVMTRSSTHVGSILWMAPEVIQQKDGTARKADIWSLGCTFIEMATAEKPWGKHAFNDLADARRHIGFSDATPPLPAALRSEGRGLIGSCLRRRPRERPWAADLLQHPFLA